MASIKYFGIVDAPFDFGIGRSSALERVHTSRSEIVFENPITFAQLTLTGTDIDFAPDGTVTGRVEKLAITTEDGRDVLEISYGYGRQMTVAEVISAFESYRRAGDLTPLLHNAESSSSFNAQEADRPLTLSFEGIDTEFYYSASRYGDTVTAGSASRYDFSGGAGKDTFIGGSGHMNVTVSNGDLVIPGSGTGWISGWGRDITVQLPEDFRGRYSYTHARETPENSQDILYRIDAVTGEAKGYADGELAVTFLNATAPFLGGRFGFGSYDNEVRYEVNLRAEDSLVYFMGMDSEDYHFTGHGTVTLMVIEGIPMKFYGSYSTKYIDIDIPAGQYDIFSRFESMNTGTEYGPHKLSVSDTTTLEVIGTNNSDRFIGGAENDIFHPFLGDDTIDGGAGYDTLIYTSAQERFPRDEHSYFISVSPPNLVVDLKEGIATSRHENVSYKQTIANIEAVFGTPMQDILIGTGRGSHLGGAGGNDILFAGTPPAADFPALANQVYRLYQAVLGRTPDAEGQAGWMTKLLVGHETPKSTVVGFMGSQEFRQKYGGLENEPFVTLLYRNVLGRDADAEGKAHWLKLLDEGVPRSEIVHGFSDSPEFIQATNEAATDFAAALNSTQYMGDIYRLYRATLEREPDAAGFQDWLVELTSGKTLAQAARMFIDSSEFVAKYSELNDENFVAQLYHNVLDRTPDAKGLAGWIALLQGGASRESLVLGFTQSQEFTIKTSAPFLEWMRLQTGDILEGGAGDDLLHGGIWADTFLFKAGDQGRDVITGINAWDRLSFEDFGFEDLVDLREHFTQQGNAVVFTDQGVEVVLENFHLSSLTDEMLTY